MHSPDFATLQTFVTVVETGSLSRAAERLETTAGAVSRRIAALEQRLELRLLNRTTRSSRVHSRTIPLQFRRNPQDESRARDCYRALVAAGIAIGMPLNRLGVEYMDGLYPPEDSPSALALRALKATFDPGDVVSPGRYAPALA
jgi:hypothetical protein